MKNLFIFSAFTFALTLQAQVDPECYRGSNSPALNYDGKQDAKEAEQECMKKKKAGTNSAVKLPANSTDEQLRAAFKSECFRYTDSSMYPDMKRDLQDEEESCISQKINAFRKPNSATPAGCEVEVGVAMHCPEGVYKFQGAHELSKVNNELNRTKDLPEKRPAAKSSKRSKSQSQ